MIDCDKLEYELCAILDLIDDENCKGFWCDGIIMMDPEICYSKKAVNDKRVLNYLAYMGKTGQEKYNVKLHFGKKALSRYARDLSVFECLPTTYSKDLIDIDISKKTLDIFLK